MLDRNLLSWTCLCLGWLISLGCGGDPVDPLQEEEQGLATSRLPVVESFEPTSAIPGSQVALHVHGQNFDARSRVDLLLSGDVIGEVQTLSTRLVTSEELVADISIADNAPVGNYSVQVTTSGGKRGIPIEDFQVVDSTRQQIVGSVTLLPYALSVAVYDTAQLIVIVRDTTGAVIANSRVVFFMSTWPRASNGWTLPAGTVDSTGLVTGHPGGCGDGTVIARSQGVDSNTVHITVGSPSGEGCWDY